MSYFLDTIYNTYDIIVSKFQKFSDKSQKDFGLTKFFWEKLLLLLEALAAVPAFFLLYYINNSSFFIFLAGMSTALTLGSFTRTRNAEKIFLVRNSLKETVSSSKDFVVFASMILLPTIALNTLVIFLCFNLLPALLLFLYVIWLTLRLHFAVCVPKPPSRSKLSRYLASLIWSLAGGNSKLPQTT